MFDKRQLKEAYKILKIGYMNIILTSMFFDCDACWSGPTVYFVGMDNLVQNLLYVNNGNLIIDIL